MTSTPTIAPGETKADRVRTSTSLLNGPILRRAAVDSFVKLNPRHLLRNPVMFVVEVGSVLTTILFFTNLELGEHEPERVLGARRGIPLVHRAVRQLRRGGRRGPRQGAGRHAAPHPVGDDGEPPPARRVHRSRCRARSSTSATRSSWSPARSSRATATSSRASRASTSPRSPASRRRSSARPAVTARPSPVGPVSSPTGSSSASPRGPGETFIDRMIALVEGSERQKTPNEIALNILLAGLTIIFLLATVSLQPFAIYADAEQSVVVLVALLVCLIPTTIGGLLSAIGIAGMDRLVRRNVLAMSGRAVEAAGDVQHAAARQDRHHHLRRPPGGRAPARAGRGRARARRRRAALEPRGRDARRTIDPRARRGALRARAA